MKPEEAKQLLLDCTGFICQECNNRHRGCADKDKHPEMIETILVALEKQTPKELHMFHCQCGMVIDDEWDFCTKCGQAVKRVTP